MTNLKEFSQSGTITVSDSKNKDVALWKRIISFRIQRLEFFVIFIFLYHFVTVASTVFSNKTRVTNHSSLQMNDMSLDEFEQKIISKVYEHSTRIVLEELEKASMRTQTHKIQPKSNHRPKQLIYSGETEKEKGDKEILLRPSALSNTNEKVITPRRLQLEDNHTSCNGTSFYLELRLDDWPQETSWELIDDEANVVVANQSYVTGEKWLLYNFTMCLEPGLYTFSLSDSFGDGIRCDGFQHGLGCHEIFLDNELVVEGPKFIGHNLNHSFDSTNPYCKANALFLVEVQLEANMSTSDWHLRHDASNEVIKLKLIPELSTNSSEFYFSCLTTGIYLFDTTDVNRTTVSCEIFSDCYTVQLDQTSLFQEKNFSETMVYSFAISQYGHVNERNCHLLPNFAPLNGVKDFQFDTRTEHIMSSLYAVSSSDSLRIYDSFQYKAACWIIYDDKLQIAAEDEFLVERYVVAAFTYAVNQNAELLLANNTCDFSEVKCNDEGHIISIDIGELFI